MRILMTLLSIIGGIKVKGRSSLSKRFIIIVALLLSVFIVTLSASFHVAMKRSAAILRNALVSRNTDSLLHTILPLATGMGSDQIATIQDASSLCRDRGRAVEDLLMVSIFRKTNDENFFRVADTLSFRENLKPEIERSDIVKEQKKINYLKRGLLDAAVDPDIYFQGGLAWQNVYVPLTIGGRKAVAQCRISVAGTWHVINSYVRETRAIRIIMALVTLITVLGVVALSILMAQNYSLLISNLSDTMEKAAGGDLNVALRDTVDTDLNRLAQSFNALVDEMKERPSQSISPTADTGPLFSTGVSLLKDGRLDNAIAVFNAIVAIKPLGFASYFNLGVAHAKKGEYNIAEEMFREALRINPSYHLSAEYIEKIQKLRERHA
ncbi:MAG: tetratricopeptide repeat protein [Spirochaetes bacterium]|nr:tetratricopeptide repeat protein [Spirochaetota bacterium]